MENISNPQKESESTLIINLNEEYKIKIEEGNQFDKSIFKDVYKAALNSVIEIVKQADKQNENDDYNNIIAFTGERGKGKSSSMISFRNALVNQEKVENSIFFDGKKEILKNKFATIDIVDPSFFRGGESLFEIILAQMFNKFQEDIKCKDSQISDDDRRNIIKQFQEVYENLQVIKSDRKVLYEKESIEALSKLATSSNLRKGFKKLISLYLKKFENKTDFLIIAIDDFDLNIVGSYDTLEDMRHFLIQSNIILFIACKMEQLNEVLHIYYKKHFINNEFDIKSKKYIDKIIPFNRRINLPSLSNLQNKNFKVFQNGNVLFETKNTGFKLSVLKLVFEKIKLFQPLNLLGQNAIVPETLRQTQNLVSTLFDDNNNLQFKRYLIEESKVDIENFMLINELEGISDDLFLLILIRKLVKIYTEKNGDYILERLNNSEKSRSFKRLNSSSIPDRISVGDVVFLLREYENSISIDDYALLQSLNILKTYISLRIGELRLENMDFRKYGFINEFTDLLPKENNKSSRDTFSFSKSNLENFDKLSSDQKMFFSLWIQYLGEGFFEYRQSLEKEIYVNLFVKGGISPIVLLNNVNNLDILSTFFGFDAGSELGVELKKWNDNSIFIKQLENPSFTIKLIDYIKIFRALEVKEALPLNYFETICLLFVYGIIYSLDKIEDEYGIDGFVSDFLKNPLFYNMIRYFNSNNHVFRVVGDLDKKYELEISSSNTKFYEIDGLAEIINNLYDKSKSDVISPTESDTSKLMTQEIVILTNLLSELENRKITSRTVGSRVDKLTKLNNHSQKVQEIITYLNEVKYGLNNPRRYENTKSEMVSFLKNILNG